MSDREKLAEIVERAAHRCLPSNTERFHLNMFVRDLISSGVVVREKGEWVMKETMIRSPFAKNAYCPFCHEETGYAHNFCPNCGADMRKGKNDVR